MGTTVRLADDLARNICFIYVMDLRRDLEEEVIPTLNQAFAEMQFLFNSTRPKLNPNKLRAVLLVHEAEQPLGTRQSQGTVPAFPSGKEVDKVFSDRSVNQEEMTI